MKWTIYDRDDNVRHESITDWDELGNAVCHDTLEYSGTWMGDCFVTLSIKSAYPIDFQIGDYLVYRGEKFVINYDPTVVKKARRGTYGEGFTYDNIKFNALSDELTRVPFHDIVLSTNELHYTSLPTFSFYAKDVDDLVDRLQANMNDWCKSNGLAEDEYWMFYTLCSNPGGTDDEDQQKTTYERTLARAKDISTDETFLASIVAQWKKIYGDGEDYKDSREDELYDRTISISNNTVWECMAMIKQQFGLNFIVRGRNVYVGTIGVPTEHIFTYGKGNGLYELEKTADNNQKVVTKLHAYGSSDNLPSRYYANLNKTPGCVATEVTKGHTHDVVSVAIKTDLIYYSKYFYMDSTGEGSTAQSYLVGLKCGDTDEVFGFVTETSDEYAKLDVFYSGSLNDKEKLEKFVAAVSADVIIYFTSYVRANTFSDSHMYYLVQDLPDNMVINSLMLPGFPSKSLAEMCSSKYDSDKDVTNYYITNPSTSKNVCFHSENGKHLVTYSSNRYDPYILSQNAAELGVLPGDINCTEDNDDNGLEKVYPTLEGMTDIDAGIGTTGARLDKVVTAEKVTDNGIWEDQEIPGFTITIPNIGFDLKQAAEDAGGNSMEISMKSGFCAARSFKVGSVQRQADMTWKLTCQRTEDTDLGIVFPYSYAANVGTPSSTMTDAYQVCKGDKYVLTGIDIDDVNYVWAASVKLLRKAIHWLCDNDYTRYVYHPKIDEIYMARQREESEAAGTTSLYEALKEGDVMLFSDDDLGLVGSVYIEKLTIKENGNNGIPTFDVTLRDDVAVGTLQRIQNQISSIRTDLESGNVSGIISSADIEGKIKTYGKRYFLSKTQDDSTTHTLGVGNVNVSGKTDTNTLDVEDEANIKGILNAKGDLNVSGSSGLNEVTFGNAKVPYIAGEQGGKVSILDDGVKLQVDYLEVTRKMTAHEIEVMKTSHIGGRLMNSAASMVCSFVYTIMNGSTPSGYVCFFNAKDGDGREIDNCFAVNDQALCQTFNIKTGTTSGFSNQYYWRKVTAISYTPKADITDSINGVTYAKGTTYGNCIVLSAVDCASGSTTPLAGDEIVQLGNRTDTSRQGAIVQSATGTAGEVPYMRYYKGINSYTLPTPFIQFAPSSSWIDATEVIIRSSGSGDVTIKKYVDQVLTDAKNYADDKVSDAESAANSYTDGKISPVSETLGKVESQMDESFYVYHGETAATPTLDNLPASEWTDEATKAEHIGDFYVASDGFCWQFRQDENYNYIWAEVNDKYLTAYVRAIDEKKRVFISRPTADAVYDEGDLWVNATYTDDNVSYANDTLVCITAKKQGDEFSISHWQAASGVTSEAITKLKNEVIEYADGLWAGSSLVYKDAQGVEHIIEKAGLLTTSSAAKILAQNYYTKAEMKVEVDGQISKASIKANQVEILSDHFKVLNGDVYADSLTLTGAFNNMLTEVSETSGYYSAEKYGGYITCLLDGSPTLYGSPDWLTCGSLVKFIGMAGKGINLPFYTCTPDNPCVPSAGDNSKFRYVRTATKFGTGELHKMTMSEMKQLVGRKFYLMNTESTGTMTVYYGVPMNENKDGSMTYISWDNKDTDYMSVGVPVGGTLIMECCLGGYKYGDAYYECIYWRYVVNIGTPLVEFNDGGTEE